MSLRNPDEPWPAVETALELQGMLASFSSRDEETSAGPVTVILVSPDGEEVRKTSNSSGWADAIKTAWIRAMVHAPPTSNPLPVECTVVHLDWYETGSRVVTGYLHRDPGTRSLRFALNPDFSDAVSLAEFPWKAEQASHSELDVGLMLLEPITVGELAGIEPILSELWRAVDEATLSETQRFQILAIAELIKAEVQDAVPQKTDRWKLVGTVRAGLKYLAKEAPKDALAWWKLIELLQKIDWPNVANVLRHV